MRKLIFSFFCLLASTSLIQAQQGTITGKVVEESSGFEVIGGTVLISGTGNGTVTDLDGTYQLKIEPGTYSLEFSYVGFATQTITDIVVTANNTVNIDVLLAEESETIDLGVTVVAQASRSTNVALLNIQKKSPVVLDGISAAQITQSGDNDVASAVRRVTGVTVEGGKYVYVRGLGDRYSKTTLNGAEIPGLDPNRNTVQMDLFPTNLIDNILVYKSFSPNLPGDFAGGYVDIATKDFPSEATLNISASAGYNTQATFNDRFISYQGGKKDWLGFDDGTRAIPDLAANTTEFPQFSQGLNNGQNAQQLADLTRSFENNWQLSNYTPTVNTNFGISYGNQKTFLGKPLGFIAALTYQRNYTSYDNGDYGIYELTGNINQSDRLTPQLELRDSRSDEEVLWGAMLSTTWKVAPSHKIGIMAMHNQSSQQTARYLVGTKFRDDPADVFQTRTWDYLERGLSTFQLSGKHVLANANNLEIDWVSSYSLSTQDNPDLRYFTNRYNPASNRFRLKPSSDNVPNRFYRNMEQYNFDNKLNVTLPFNQWNGLSSKFKTGLSYVYRDRLFRENRYSFNNQALTFNGSTFDYFAEENLIQADGEGFVDINGVYVTDNYDPKNNYDADQSVAAAYAMVELPLTAKLRAVTGVRVEKTAIRLLTFDTDVSLQRFPFLDGQTKLIDNTDFLPSINLNYEMNDAMKLRFAYSRTLARPSFRELAPFASFLVDGGFVFVGNPELERTLIDNVDLRWEIFPENRGDMFSLSAFYKDFTNPIERTFNPEAQNTELTFRNVDNATLYGAEVEIKKGLGTLADVLTPFSIGANFSYVVSETDIDENELELIRSLDPNAKSTREMFGQAPYTANFLISFKNQKGTTANASFNVVGERINVVTRGATPNYFDQPAPNLNFNISQELISGFQVRLSAGNLLDAAREVTATYKGEEYKISSFKTGRTFSLGLSYNLSN